MVFGTVGWELLKRICLRDWFRSRDLLARCSVWLVALAAAGTGTGTHPGEALVGAGGGSRVGASPPSGVWIEGAYRATPLLDDAADPVRFATGGAGVVVFGEEGAGSGIAPARQHHAMHGEVGRNRGIHLDVPR